MARFSSSFTLVFQFPFYLCFNINWFIAQLSQLYIRTSSKIFTKLNWKVAPKSNLNEKLGHLSHRQVIPKGCFAGINGKRKVSCEKETCLAFYSKVQGKWVKLFLKNWYMLLYFLTSTLSSFQQNTHVVCCLLWKWSIPCNKF